MISVKSKVQFGCFVPPFGQKSRNKKVEMLYSWGRSNMISFKLCLSLDVIYENLNYQVTEELLHGT